MNASSRRNSLTIGLLVIIVIMGVEIVYLIYQNRRLQTILAEVSSVQVLQHGQIVPPFAAENLDGIAVEVQYGEREPFTVLIWFSPACHVCEENTAFWNDIYSRYSSDRVRFLALCDAEVDEARVYVAEHALTFPVISTTDNRLIEAYNGRVMPQTALISSQGGIEKVWPGELEQSRQDEIIAALDSLAK